ncbi:MBL fold metallo-hydrolase [Agromyces sp. SYSU T00194]|uniref:MBL fold metallo-hydrolase n=1 Tax=Agromyces chitinivorans TaxID=3158560 RepID=UPI003399BFCB
MTEGTRPGTGAAHEQAGDADAVRTPAGEAAAGAPAQERGRAGRGAARRAERGAARRAERGAALRVERVGRHLFAAITEHVNWLIHAGPDGVTLIDSGYLGQREQLLASLAAVGCGPADVDAVLLTHAHADHLGGAAWLAAEHGTPVHAARGELPNLHRDVLEQVSPARLLPHAWRSGVLPWAGAILPLLEGRATLGVPAGTALSEAEDGRIEVPGRPRVIHVAGHTTGHAAYDFVEEGVLATGDALVTGHRTLHSAVPQLLPSVYHHDLLQARACLVALRASESHLLLPGHGDPWHGPASRAVDIALLAGAPW